MRVYLHHTTIIITLICLYSNGIAQNVGIGTTSPLEKLHVNGNIKGDTLKPNALKLTPNAGNGKILTSDANGNANWQERSSATGSVGFGSWGDCSVNNISEYNPVSDPAGLPGDNFGSSVAISGNYAIIGAPNADDPVANSGAVCFYEFDGTNWVIKQKFTEPTGANGARFGSSVAISGNFAVAGAYYEEVNGNIKQGSASVYQFDGTDWVFMEKIVDATGLANAMFGYSVAMYGNLMIIGAPNETVGGHLYQGSVSIFLFDGTSWVLMQKITDPAGNVNDQFGAAVSISDEYAVIGLPWTSVSGIQDGAVIIYHLEGGTLWQYMTKLYNTAVASHNHMGSSVSISGNYLVIASTKADYGAYINEGAITFYQLKDPGNPTWVFMQTIQNDFGEDYVFFGSSVCLSGDFAIASAPNDKIDLNQNQGSVIIFKRIGATWRKLQSFTDPAGSAGDNFGQCVSIDQTTKRFLVGSPYSAWGIGNAVFGKINN